MSLVPALRVAIPALALCLGWVGSVRGQTATNITGLYYTGMSSSGGLATAGTQETHWKVTYASTNGGSSANTNYEGYAYVISSSYIPTTYVANTSYAQWVTAPGAKTSSSTSSTSNIGGAYLPGNGTTTPNEGIYAYTLAFQITGSGSAGTVVTNAISITLTVAADDQYSIYVNPTYTNGSTTPDGTAPTGTAVATVSSAWTSTTQVVLTNTGSSANAKFVIGTNYLTIVVDNTNSLSGSSKSSSLNASGLLVYQLGNAITIDGNPIQGVIPEVGSWLPAAGALGLFAWLRFRRRNGIPVSPPATT